MSAVSSSIQDIGFVAVTFAAVAALWAFFHLAEPGSRPRAAEASRLGVQVGWMLALAWGLAAAPALSGMMAVPTCSSAGHDARRVALRAGGGDLGARQPRGGRRRSLGVVLNLLGTYVDFFAGEMRLVGGLLVILGVLYFRPAGLFGKTAVRRV
jgi:branched-chain amino acid transport system permease protein